MKNKLFLLFFVFCSSNAVFAQSPPTPLLELSKKVDVIVPKGELTSEQREYLWEKTSQDRAGFLVVNVSMEYIDTINNFLSSPLLNKEVPANLIKFNNVIRKFGYSFVGNVQEDLNRNDGLYRDKDSNILMLTVWNYKKAGAAITSAEEFFNQKIEGHDGILALAIADDVPRALWKLTWSADGVQYELYQTDKVGTYGKPARTPEETVDIAQEMSRSISAH